MKWKQQATETFFKNIVCPMHDAKSTYLANCSGTRIQT
jgi:hypothetical protein